ncbi:hypothetical protein Lepto7376_1993 [[Leptolyngbya] sp. PCC 7376]|uniref:hypothetical protein n=1 Tax=[Leptolyngbya] sp. PCC 7376 TaxID=111781 RepID=UPI00029F3D0E|nr:hypothetical protein [[Leptolyngbya] sp. PCC 7376]AFY38303.1 hypothetical protein Lepto7376_1993 [[Leptolyngbya] sp. PCC 7376]
MMEKSTTTKGICQFCGKEFSKGGISRHLKSCHMRQSAITTVETNQRKAQTIYHLQIQSYGDKNFWLHLEMRGDSNLRDLDLYLRAIWLECCGHLSAFSHRHSLQQEIAMSHTISWIFEELDQLEHIYDWGTPSETIIRHVNHRQGKMLNSEPIFLMARNNPPVYSCIQCEKPATHFCQECMYEDGTTGMLCDRHTKGHPHEDYGEPISLVNSPRLGICGYDGPAEAPY